MALWLAGAVMTAAAVLAVLWPLSRRHDPFAAGNELHVYRDQLDEISSDRAAGRLGDAEAEAARIEVSRRLLAAAEQAQPQFHPSTWRRRAVAIAALVGLPLGSAALYGILGSPTLPAQPLAARIAPAGTPPVAELLAKIEAHLEGNPQDGRGWEVVAPVYLQAGRFDDAVRAWRNTLTYSGSTAAREANFGEALAAAAGGIVTADAKQAFQRALTLDGGNAKARYFIGLAAEQDGRPAEAVEIWQALLASAPADAPWLRLVQENLSRLAVSGSAGPSSDDIAAAAKLNPDQQREMITGMVERLATRLKTDGGDVDGWLRLVRAYTVLGEHDKARSAVSEARRAMANEAGKLQRFENLIKGLGLEG